MARQIRVLTSGDIYVNGQRRGLLSADTTTGTEVQVAQGTVAVDPRGGTIYGGDTVAVRAVLDGRPTTIITGTVDSETLQHAPRAISFNVLGLLDAARHEIGTPDLPDDEALDDDGNPLPIATYANMTGAAIIMALLDLCGVAYDPSQIADDGIALGTVKPVTLGKGQTPFQIISGIDDDYGMRTFELPDGTIRRIPWTGLPGGTPGLVLQSGVNWQEGQRVVSLGEMYNRINVSGLADDDLGTPRATIQADSRVSPSTGKPYIPTPPQYRATDHSSEYLETHEAVTAFGARFIGEHNRAQEAVTGRLLPPNPGLVGGTSTYLIDPQMGVDESSVYRIGNVHNQLNAQGLRTDLTLRGGYASEGVDPNGKPTASFTITVLREHIGGQGDIFVIVADASASVDLEGAYHLESTVNEEGQEVPGVDFNGIFRYGWASTLGSAPRLLDRGARAIWTVDSNPSGKSITLTVYDSQLATGTLTKTIFSDDADQPLVRDIWLAVTSELLFSNDGERTWKHIAVPAVHVPEQAADTFTLALTGAGLCYKVTTDLAPTVPPTAPTNARAANIRYHHPDTTVPGDRCWLGCADGGVWFSADKGETWIRRGTIPDGQSIYAIIESPYAEGDIYATAGNRLVHSYDAGATWEIVYAHPNAALLATKPAAGFQMMFVGFHGPPPGTDPDNEDPRIRERRNQVSGDWTRSTSPTSLPPGTYKVAFSYRAAGGETALSPIRDVVVPSGGIIAIPPVTPLVQGATGVFYYCSQVAGSPTLRRAGEGTGDETFTIAQAPTAGVPPQATGNTLAKLAAPTINPLSTAIVAPAGTVDFPAQPAAPSLGVYAPKLTMVGLAPDGGGHSWYADADQDFTFTRGEYPSDHLGAPVDSYRDGLIDDVVYVLGTTGFGKTTTGFRADCFRIYALTGGQVGAKIGIGKIGPAPPPKGALLWIAGVYSEDTASGMVVNSLTDSGLHRVCEAGGFPMPASQYVIFAVAASGVLVAVGLPGQPTSNYGATANNMLRSEDGGATWSVVSIPPVHYASFDGHGGGYAVVYPTSGGAPAQTIYRTTDGGSTWIEIPHQPGDRSYENALFDVHIDPTNPDALMLRYYAGGDRATQYARSTDGGQTWSDHVIAVGQDSGNSGTNAGEISPSGQYLLARDASAGANDYIRSPVGGPRGAGVGLLGSFVRSFARNGTGFFLYGGENTGGDVRWSTDDGASFVSIYNASHAPADVAGGDFENPTQVHGFVPGDATNEWAVLGVPHHGTIVLHEAGVDPSSFGRWSRIPEETVAAAFPDGVVYCVRGGAIRLPGS